MKAHKDVVCVLHLLLVLCGYVDAVPFVLHPRRQAMLCILAKNCNEAGYTRLIEALCQEHGILILYVSGRSMILYVVYEVRSPQT